MKLKIQIRLNSAFRVDETVAVDITRARGATIKCTGVERGRVYLVLVSKEIGRPSLGHSGERVVMRGERASEWHGWS